MSSLPTDAAQLRQLLLDLLVTHAYREGEFVLASGQTSPYYINCKPVILQPQGAWAVGHLLHQQLPVEAQAVAGLTLGADPLVSSVAVVSAPTDHPVAGLIIRKEPKGYGARSQIEGPELPQNAVVVVVEDVVTTGQSALKAVRVLRDVGYRVDQVMAVVDRQQGAAEVYATEGLGFMALFTLPDLQACHAQRSVL
ncbi:MAG: orotate phosphoribosyltransferase [Gloeomargaritaceae cyanobacterium C42_A2020_066]|nr:orotate phosphoribosyltransferase [Gloeomargaritaceae cyanobacterium C42_A2020_066]